MFSASRACACGMFAVALASYPALVDAQEVPAPKAMEEPGKTLVFSFKYAPWKDVLDWLATESGLALSLEAPPSGSFNFQDTRRYSTQEAIDVVNSLLLLKGYTLVRREKMLLLVNLEDGIPPNLVMQVTPSDLDRLGDYELVSCLFPLGRMNPEDAEAELGKLLGPQGDLVLLSVSRQVVVTETAGKLRTMREILRRVENPSESEGTKIVPLPLKHVSPDEALVVIRQLMDIPEGELANEAGTVRLSTEATGARIFVKAPPESVAEIRDILALIDVPSEYQAETSILESPQLISYPVQGSDPDTTMEVLQTLLAGMPDVRMTLDPLTNNIVVLARAAQHATIRATLGELANQHDQIEIFNLDVVDPATARIAIESLFGKQKEGEEDGDNARPRVDVNITTRQLLVRGRPADVERIRTLLDKMGEDGSVGAAGDRGNIRILPMYTGSMSRLLEQAQLLWPSIRGNRIRAVTPANAIEAVRGLHSSEPEDAPPEASPAEPPPAAGERNPVPGAPEFPSSLLDGLGVFEAHRPPPLRRLDASDEYLAQVSPSLPTPDEAATSDVSEYPEILVAPGPNGLLIASEDEEALDEFEALLEALSDPALSQSSEYTVYYLKFARADETAKLLNQLMNGSASSGGGSGGGGLADLALGSMGGLFESAADALSLSGGLQIVPDLRMNALFLRGSTADVDLVRQLLQVIDQAHSPEDVETMPPPRLIPVLYANASDVAATVSQVYSQRLSSTREAQASQNRSRQPDVRDIMRAMRQGGGSDAETGESPTSEPAITIGVDARSNSLVVSAPDPTFEQIRALVHQLDMTAIESGESVRVVTLSRSNPQTVQAALNSMFGDKVQTASAPSSSGPQSRNSNSGGQSRQEQAAAAEQLRRRMEFFNALRRANGGGGQFGGRGGERGRGGAGGGRGSEGGGRGPGNNGRGGGRGDR